MGLTKEEKDFILSLFQQTRIGVSEENAVEVCMLVRSISDKIKKDGEV